MTTSAFKFLTEAGISRKLGKALKEVARLSRLQAPAAAEIHQLRRNLKVLRAWICLLREQRVFGKPDKLDRCLAALARQYSAARDAHVRRQTLQWLAEQASPETAAAQPGFAGSQVFMQIMHDEKVAPPDPALLARADRALQQLADSTSAYSRKNLRQGLRSTYRKARRLYRNAAASANAEDLHRLRKWAKHLLNQVELVIDRKTARARTLHKQLKALTTTLGTCHDLVMLNVCLQALKDAATAPEAVTGEMEQIEQKIEQQMAQQMAQQIEQQSAKALAGMLEESLQLAGQCFSEKTGRWFSP